MPLIRSIIWFLNMRFDLIMGGRVCLTQLQNDGGAEEEEEDVVAITIMTTITRQEDIVTITTTLTTMRRVHEKCLKHCVDHPITQQPDQASQWILWPV